MSSVAQALADTAVVAKRNVIKIRRVPEVLTFVLISPIMFVLLFGYVFGNAIEVAGSSYREFLIAGIFAQTVMFGATFTGVGIAEDMEYMGPVRLAEVEEAQQRIVEVIRSLEEAGTITIGKGGKDAEMVS